MKPIRISGGLAFAILIIISLLSGTTLGWLHLNNAPQTYFPQNAPAVQFENALREDFPTDEVLIALFEGDDLFSDDFLVPFRRLTQQLQALPLVDRVLTVTTVEQIRGTEDGFGVEPLLSEATMASLEPAERRARVLDDRFAPGLLTTEQGDALALILRPEPLDGSLQRLALETGLLEAVAEQELTDKLIALAGQVVLDVAQLRAMLHDTMIFVPGTLGIGLLLIWLMFRRLLAVVISALTISAVVHFSLALLIIAGKPYTLISAILPPLMSALTIAMLIHWFNALTLADRHGLSGAERIDWAYQRIARPTLFAALTTAAGLASLGFSPIQPIAAFGLVAAGGLLMQCAISLLLIPALLLQWDHAPWARGSASVRWLDRPVRALRNLGLRRAGWVVGLTLALMALGLPFISQIQVETDLLRFFKSQAPISQATDHIQERLTGVTTLEIVFDAPERDALKSPEHLRRIAELQSWLNNHPAVTRTLSLVDLIEEMHWGFHAEDPAYRMLPDNRALIAQYLLIYDGDDLYELVNRDFTRTRLTLNLSLHGARALNEFIGEMNAWLADREMGELQVTAAGFGRLFADQEQLTIDGQIRSLAVAIGLIALLMLLMWRSLADTALTMIPNLAPALLIFIIMGLFGIWLDMATAMIASVTVGIAVDDTVHLFHAYRRRRRSGRSVVWSLARAYRQAGRALTATTLILCAQFLLLTTSSFVPTIQFGLLTAIGLLAALLFDLLFLPALLVVLSRPARKRRAEVPIPT
ncbi:efflux transporter, putative, hydrophobe/amphiphile efflux-3 (HAE3) family [Thiorhodovibrio winogradskyi]|uniref:Efflux transporter, putative, hydrophobe/amphiphile efflux-3 (HAE3) family n=1 Tax=Thiorhodovibrio winogradskyi TaxID=77007 RepID=A0ABZ0SE78_9GAMM|nr:MMPL family transporter [Thiorhodovibrio winogradskyi]